METHFELGDLYLRAEREVRESVPGTCDQRDLEWVDIGALVPGESPRMTGLSEDHVRVLADSDAPLPPILVQRGTWRVVDGMHRLAAARLRGRTAVPVRFFDGGEDDAFVMAVRMNKAHGLPLTLAEREAAAIRIITSHPHYSDRGIAAISGLSAKTVAAIRRRTGSHEPTDFRIGSDGRVRPVNTADARRIAARALSEHPGASLRQIARIAGVSPGTVRDVRDRLRRGEEPVPDQQRARLGLVGRDTPGGLPGPRTGPAPDDKHRDRGALLQRLLNDPALKFTESGRSLLRWLYPRAAELEEWQTRIDGMPPHCAYALVELARSCSAEWQDFAARLEQSLRNSA